MEGVKDSLTFSITIEDEAGNTLRIEEAGTEISIDSETLILELGARTVVRLPILYVRKVELPK